MIASAHRDCPHCGADIEYEVEINEGSYPPSECPECGKPIDFTDGDDQADAVATLADRARERAREDSQ